MQKKYFRFLRNGLGLLTLLIGISSKVAAQYGVMMNYFKINGNIKSEICQENLANIAIRIEDPSTQYISEITTDENGNFNFFGDTDWGNNKLKISYKDLDGDENNGSYQSGEFIYEISRNSNLNIQMQHVGIPPCLIEDTSKYNNDLVGNTETLKCPSKEESTPLDSEASYFDAILYPNPNFGCFNLRFNLEFRTQITMHIFSSNGKMIVSEVFTMENHNQEKKIDIEGLASGNYILSLNDGRKTISKNFIIQK